MHNYSEDIKKMGKLSKEASKVLRTLSTADKNQLLLAIKEELINAKADILSANTIDVADARAGGLKEAMVERLSLTEQRFNEMIQGLDEVANLSDPVGEVDAMWLNEAGLSIGQKRVPLGVIAMIYESRPNVTVDATALCLKTGNAVILKGGSDALTTNIALLKAIDMAIEKQGMPVGTVQLVKTPDRDFTKQLLSARDAIDCVIPRGGAGLIQFVAEHSKVPMIETGTGNCHIYVDEHYSIEKSVEIILNAKVQRPGACNAVETVLIHNRIAPELLPTLLHSLKAAEVGVALCDKSWAIAEASNCDLSSAWHATEVDYQTEYLDFKLAIKVVDNLMEAVDHIDNYSTGHSEAILTDCYEHAQKFLASVDSSAVYVNASTRFTDGGQFGFGAEIGISTQKLHARGPMGLKALTTIKYIVYGTGQIRK